MATLRQMEYLVAVAETGSVTAAAVAVHVSQPALSQALAGLEREYGGRLIERTGRSARLTAAGRAVLPQARAALAAAESARRAARAVVDVDGGEVHLACAQSVTIGVLPPLLARWRRDHPLVAVRLEEHGHSDAVAAAVEDGRADIGVSPAPSRTDGLELRTIGSEELVVVVAPDDPLAGRGAIDLAELGDRAWVHYHPAHGLSGTLDRLAAAAGFVPEVAVRVHQTSAAPVLAAAGLGPALVPSTLLGSCTGGAVLRIGEGVRRDLVAWARTPDDPLAVRFLDELVEGGIPDLAPPAQAVVTS